MHFTNGMKSCTTEELGKLGTNTNSFIQINTLLIHSNKLSGSSFHRDLSSNAITFLPQKVFGNLAQLTNL